MVLERKYIMLHKARLCIQRNICVYIIFIIAELMFHISNNPVQICLKINKGWHFKTTDNQLKEKVGGGENIKSRYYPKFFIRLYRMTKGFNEKDATVLGIKVLTWHKFNTFKI